MKKRILTLTLAVSTVLLFGCLESQLQKTSPKQGVKNALVKLQNGYVKDDVESIMSVYSEDYSGSNGEAKEQVAQFINGMKEQGYLAGTKVVLDDVVIKVQGNTVTAAPVRYSGDWGEVDYDTTFKKEGSTWKMISGEQSY